MNQQSWSSWIVFGVLPQRYIPKLAVSYVHSPKCVLSKTHTHPSCCRRGSKCFLSFISKMKRVNKLLKHKGRSSHGELTVGVTNTTTYHKKWRGLSPLGKKGFGAGPNSYRFPPQPKGILLGAKREAQSEWLGDMDPRSSLKGVSHIEAHTMQISSYTLL